MKTYEELKIEVIAFDNEDVIVTSPGGGEEETISNGVIEMPFVPADQM